MKICMVGSGNVGATLGRRWAECGHEVVYGSRAPASGRMQRLLAEMLGATAADVGQAAQDADVIVLAIPFGTTQEALELLGDLDGRVLVDCTNPVSPHLDGLTVGHHTSAAEEIARWAPGARVVKCFNTTGAANMADPKYGDDQATMFLCGDDEEARQIVGGLATDLGFDVVETGALRTARYLEPLAMLWIHMAYTAGHGPGIAFKLLRRE